LLPTVAAHPLTWEKLRAFFRNGRRHVTALAALKALVNDGEISYSQISDTLSRYRIDVERVDPTSAQVS